MSSEGKGTVAAKQEKRKKYIIITFSIIAAMALWLYVIESTNPSVTRSYSEIPVEVLNLDELQSRDLTVQSDVEVMVGVRVSGRRSKIVRMKDTELVATLDLSGCTEGENYVGVNVHTPDSVELVSVEPSQILVNTEKIVSEEKEIVVEIQGNTPSKSEAVCLEQELENMDISGAESLVERVTEVQAVIAAGDLEEEAGAFTAELVPVDENGAEVEGIVLPQKEMEVKAQLYAVREVSLTVSTRGSLPDGLQLTSVKSADRVSIALPADMADSVTSVRAEEIDLSSITRDTTVDLQLNLPDGVRLAEGEEVPQAEIVVSEEENAAEEGQAPEQMIRSAAQSENQS